MADQSDIENTLASRVTDLLYPQGTVAPSALGTLIRIFRGWPNQASLNADLAAGHVAVTIFPDPSQFTVTTRFIDPPTIVMDAYPNLAIDIAGNAATISGSADPGQVAGLLIDNTAFVHRTAPGDTPALVASILAGYINTTRPASVSDVVITIPGATSLIGRVVADQSIQTETRRQTQGFRISCWCPNPTTRDTAAILIDQGLSSENFLSLADGSAARLRLTGTTVFDQSQNANLYRRDLLLHVEYATTVITTLPSLIFGNTTVAPGPSADNTIAVSLLR